MFPYQFESSIVLGVSACASILVFFLNRDKGAIKLPLHAGADYAADEIAAHDPFDVTTLEDTTDGYPIEPDAFWASIRWRKIFITLLLTANTCVSGIALGWSTASNESKEIAVRAVYLAFSIYILSISIRSTSQIDARHHSESILHLTTLTTIATLLSGIISILPSNLPPVTVSIDAVLWFAQLGTYALVCLITFTTSLGPPMHYPSEKIYSEDIVRAIINRDEENVSGAIGASPWGMLLFSYTTKVVWLGNSATSLDIGDLPIVPSYIRATVNYTEIKKAMRNIHLQIGSWTPKQGSGWNLGYRLLRLNFSLFLMLLALAAISAVLYYTPAIFLRQFISYLEADGQKEDRGWGWVYALGLFLSNAATNLVSAQLWSLSTATIQVRLRIQLNSILFAKTLVRKDVATSASPLYSNKDGADDNSSNNESTEKKDEDNFTSKAQIMTLMTTDVDRVSELAWHSPKIVDAPIALTIGVLLLYRLLGVSCFVGLAVACIFLPINHYAGNIILGTQENLMKARDERVGLMNEILGGIRMLKFMAWERKFEQRVMKVRGKELKYLKLTYLTEILLTVVWNATPILVTLISFWHYTVVRRQVLTPSIAFTSILVFQGIQLAVGALPEIFLNVLQSVVSLRRIEKYLNGAEVSPVPPLHQQSFTVAFRSCTVTWPQDMPQTDVIPSAIPTPMRKFMLVDMTLEFPTGELSLVCGKLGSGKTLLLLALLGEADVLAGQVLCPRSPPNAIASFNGMQIKKKDWVVEGLCAYVPQAAWLRNASIKVNILFGLPFDEERYRKTLEVCALVDDLEILEDGDESEVGERGVNLSGGQKARVSLARAVYSRASVLLLDDVLSAVDAHTAHHLYHECLKGELVQGRTVILVSHHVQLCAPGSHHIVALDNGRIVFEGHPAAFQASSIMGTLVQSLDTADIKEEPVVELPEEKTVSLGTSSELDTPATPQEVESEHTKKPPRKLAEEEKRAVGRIDRDIWLTYIRACGNGWYWLILWIILIVASLSPVFENYWLRHWSNLALQGKQDNPVFYITVYALITMAGFIVSSVRWLVLYSGSIRASAVLYKGLLEAVLFADTRFHDTVNRGRLLNRFGKDFEGVDSTLPNNFGRSITFGFSAITSLITVSVVGGLPFIMAMAVLGVVYYNAAKVYGQTSRDLRRLDSVTRSPIYSIYGETVAGSTILRAFGASSKFLRDMLRCVDTNCSPYYWMWGVNRWLAVRFNLLSSAIIGVMAIVCLITPGIDASLAGFTLTFASTVTNDLLSMVRQFVGLEQSMVALERIKEYSELKKEPPEYIDPRPPASWPSTGHIRCEGLVVRYAPELPDVLHRLDFEIRPGEKVGILGRTGSGKSTLALSFFRFVEPTEGRIIIDGVDIAKIGLTDLRSRLTIIPQDPTILSGSLRSTLDVFDEYEDAEIFEALHRVHLITSADAEAGDDAVNANVFRNLDSAVSEGGENISTGEKQLLCMARALLKHSKVLVMDEATASIDYATDEVISKVIRREFADSTILTIAHRLRTVIDYDRVILLDQGRIIEFDQPQELLKDPSSKFYALCKATGKEEFTTLKRLAGI